MVLIKSSRPRFKSSKSFFLDKMITNYDASIYFRYNSLTYITDMIPSLSIIKLDEIASRTARELCFRVFNIKSYRYILFYIAIEHIDFVKNGKYSHCLSIL